MRKVAWLVMVAAVVIGAAGFAVVHVFGGSGQPAEASTSAATPAVTGYTTQTYSMKAAGLTRHYTVVKPKAALKATTPVIVVLEGINSTVPQEITRDQLTPYADAGKAELVYPEADGESWNAGGCCGYAYQHNVNDQAFLKALVAQVNPGNAHKVYVVGYSNGARMAYRIACTDPGLFDAYAMVKGVPTAGCTLKKAVSLIQVDSTDDPEVAYLPGGKSVEPGPAVTTVMAGLRQSFGCPSASARLKTQDLTETSWKCGSARLAFAVWDTGKHSYPRPPASKPGASPVIWAFFTNSPLRSLPAA